MCTAHAVLCAGGEAPPRQPTGHTTGKDVKMRDREIWEEGGVRSKGGGATPCRGYLQATFLQSSGGTPPVCVKLLLYPKTYRKFRKAGRWPPSYRYLAVTRTFCAGGSQGQLPTMTITSVRRNLIEILFGIGLVGLYNYFINRMSFCPSNNPVNKA